MPPSGSRPDLGDLIPWNPSTPRLNERDIQHLPRDECEAWITRLTGERRAIEAAISEHERRRRIANLIPTGWWIAHASSVSKRCGALMALIYARLRVLNRETKQTFQDVFIQAAYEVLGNDQIEAVLQRVYEIAPHLQSRDKGPAI